MDIFDTWIVQQYIAHRGLCEHKFPENTLGSFQSAIDLGYAIEFDVQQIADGTVVVFHDSTLKRLTGKDGYLKNLKKEDLKNCYIANSQYSIPTLEEVLKFINGRTPILIELKNYGKVGSLEKAVWEHLKSYKGEYAIQSFNPYSLSWFKKNAPSVIRGQISGFFKNQKLSLFKKIVLKRMAFNKTVSEPHFISYDATTLPNRFVEKWDHLPIIAWTIRSQEEYMKIVGYCDNIIFEGFEPKL